MALALLNATRVLLTLVPEISSTEGFHTLYRRYAKLYRQGIQQLRRAEAKQSDPARR
jgi:hypothetical protein